MGDLRSLVPPPPILHNSPGNNIYSMLRILTMAPGIIIRLVILNIMKNTWIQFSVFSRILKGEGGGGDLHHMGG